MKEKIEVPKKVLVNQQIIRKRTRRAIFGRMRIGNYWITKSFWQDLERTWTTEVRVWETLYDCVKPSQKARK